MVVLSSKVADTGNETLVIGAKRSAYQSNKLVRTLLCNEINNLGSSEPLNNVLAWLAQKTNFIAPVHPRPPPVCKAGAGLFDSTMYLNFNEAYSLYDGNFNDI